MKLNYATYLLLFVFSLGFITTQAQEADFKQRRYRPAQADFQKFVKEAYGDRADELVFENPSELEKLKNHFNRVMVFKLPIERAKRFPKLSDVPMLSTSEKNKKEDFNPAKFNFLNYQFDFSLDKKQFFYVEGTEFIVAIDVK